MSRSKVLHKRKLNSTHEQPVTFSELGDLEESVLAQKSNLFDLQISELTKEYLIDAKEKKTFDQYLKSFHEFIREMPKIPKTSISSYLKSLKTDQVSLPFRNICKISDGKFIELSSQVHCWLSGSYHMGAALKPRILADLVVILPKEFFQKGDEQNYLCHFKKSLFLQHLAVHLLKWDKIQKLEYLFEHEEWTPYLLLTLKMSTHFCIKIIVVLPTDAIQTSSLQLDCCNVNLEQLSFNETIRCHIDIPAKYQTPYYNQELLHEITFRKNFEFFFTRIKANQFSVNTLCLCKVWLKHLNLYQTYGTVDGNLLMSIWCLLIETEQITSLTRPFSAFRIFLKVLVRDDWSKSGCSLSTDTESATLNHFHSIFNIVFLDATGQVNVARHLSLASYQRLKYEASVALRVIDDTDSGQDSFSILFLRKSDFVSSYDQLVHVNMNNFSWIKENFNQNYINCALDRLFNFRAEAVNKLYYLLSRALENRATLVSFSQFEHPKFSVSSKLEKIENDLNSLQGLWIGFLLNPNTSMNNEEVIGPSANLPSALEFRNFWKGISQVIKYPDASILEVVRFESPTNESIFTLIVRHIITSYNICTTNDLLFLSKQLDLAIATTNFHSSLKSSASNKILDDQEIDSRHSNFSAVFEELITILKAIKKDFLPLSIRSVSPASSTFSYTSLTADYLPIVNTNIFKNKKNNLSSLSVCVFDKNEPEKLAVSPRSISIISPPEKYSSWHVNPTITQVNEVVIEFVPSSKWPDELESIKHTKTAFLITLAAFFRDYLKIPSVTSLEYMDIFYQGFIFRLHIYLPRELQHLMDISQEINQNNRYSYDRYQELYRRLFIKPIHIRYIKSFGLRHPSFFNTCRLVKYWVNSQLLRQHIPEEVIELLVVGMYKSVSKFTNYPSHHVRGFIQFLDYISQYDFTRQVVMKISFSDENCKSEDDKLNSSKKQKKDFDGNKNIGKKNFVPLVICTPFDPEGIFFTRNQPNSMILKRLQFLAHSAMNSLKESIVSYSFKSKVNIFRTLFTPNLKDFDIVVKMKQAENFTKKKETNDHYIDNNSIFPVVDFDPVEMFFNTLMKNYCHCAYIFNGFTESYPLFALVWKKDVASTSVYKPFDTFAVSPAEDSVKNKKKTIDINVQIDPERILQEIKFLGGDMISEIVINRPFSKS